MDTPQKSEDWHVAATVDDLAQKGRMVVKLAGKQIALFRSDSGKLWACNNRCPHEGYPLSQGTASGRDDCILTCNWHNWKFDLNDGTTLTGGDALRVYPVKEEGGTIYIDVTDPPQQVVIDKALSAIRETTDRYQYDRILREVARLRKAGAEPIEAVRDIIRANHDRYEFGTTHAVPAAADWLRLSEHFDADAPETLACVGEAVGHFVWDARREDHFPFARSVAPWDADRFVDAVEEEDEEEAVARVRGALADDLGWEDMQQGFARAALAHYEDFGHSAIYTYKMTDLLDRLGEENALKPLALMLARSLVMATREDLIPEFKEYAPALEKWRAGTGSASAADPSILTTGSVRAVLDHIAECGPHADPIDLYDALMAAGSVQMLNYDISRQDRTGGPVSQNVGWLDFSHTLTFGNAVRKLAGRDPGLWAPGLLQIGCFLGRNSGFLVDEEDRRAEGMDDPQAFYDALYPKLVDHGEFEYIVACHKLKLTTALREECRERPNAAWHGIAASALERLLHSPIRRKNPVRTAAQSIDFVAAEG